MRRSPPSPKSSACSDEPTVTFALRIRCDAGDCTAEALIASDGDGGHLAPCCAENLPNGRAHFVIDTGWITMPDGWTFASPATPGADLLHVCPAHREPT